MPYAPTYYHLYPTTRNDFFPGVKFESIFPVRMQISVKGIFPAREREKAIGAGTPMLTPSIPASIVSRNVRTFPPSFVKIHAPFANRDWFVNAIASSKFLTRLIDKTGANISSCQMVISLV